MQIKSILAGAAIALAASVGSAYAADPFTTLDGVQAQPMNTAEMDGVRGGGHDGELAGKGIELSNIPGAGGPDTEAFVHGVTALACTGICDRAIIIP